MKCSLCGREFTIGEQQEGSIQEKNGKPACDGCYYRELGELVEGHPIFIPKQPTPTNGGG